MPIIRTFSTLFITWCFVPILVSTIPAIGGLSTDTPAVINTQDNNSNYPTRPQLVKEALKSNSPIYYFGLGSNMSRTKLENRSLCGSKIKIQRMEAAVVPGYRLAFNMRGFPPLEPGMGSLEPLRKIGQDGGGGIDDEISSAGSSSRSKPLLSYKDDECHGALIKLSAQDYEKVMRSEGVGANDGDNPNQGYDEIVVTAIPYGTNRHPVQAVALRAREHVRLEKDPCPSPRYMDILREGAKELGLKPCYQEFLSNHPVQTVSPLLRKIAITNLVWTATLSFRLKIRQISKLQSWLLFQVYTPTTSPMVLRIMSEIATCMILLPGSVFGLVLLMIMMTTGTLNPMMKLMVDRYW